MDFPQVLRDILPFLADPTSPTMAENRCLIGNMSTLGNFGIRGTGVEDLLLPLWGNLLVRTLLFVYQAMSYLGVDSTVLMTATAFASAIYLIGKHMWPFVWQCLEKVTTSVTVKSENEIFDHVMAWLARQPRIRRSRRLLAETAGRCAWEDRHGATAKISPKKVSEDGREFFNFSNQKAATPARYVPAQGFSFFWHQGRLFMLDRRHAYLRHGDETRSLETLVIYTFGFSSEPIKNLLSSMTERYYEDCATKTEVYAPSTKPWETWQRSVECSRRPMKTVVLHQKQKVAVLDDMNRFLDPLSEEWYSDHGLPLRRGYLFHGPPGTGKTSFSLALAGSFGLDIYCISLADPALTDGSLLALFINLPRRCIVLLEDIDVACVKRTEDVGEPGETKKRKGMFAKKDGITLAGLLNATDGVASHEGHILILTTNKPENLDDALIRPGRIDMKVEFSNATQEQASQLFECMYSVTTSTSFANFEEKQPRPPLEQAVEKQDSHELGTIDDLGTMAADFGSRIIAGMFSPADIQNFLISYKGRPRDALDKIDSWVESKRKKNEVSQQKPEESRRLARRSYWLFAWFTRL